MVPPWLLTQLLIGVAKFLPAMKLVPNKDLAEAAFKDLKKREMVKFFVLKDHFISYSIMICRHLL